MHKPGKIDLRLEHIPREPKKIMSVPVVLPLFMMGCTFIVLTHFFNMQWMMAFILSLLAFFVTRELAMNHKIKILKEDHLEISEAIDGIYDYNELIDSWNKDVSEEEFFSLHEFKKKKMRTFEEACSKYKKPSKEKLKT
jgi:hypothetical protein